MTDEALINLFLYSSESDYVEFKRQQYPFSKATDDDKFELLKDILGMVNSWRNQTGYIVIGIIESNTKPNSIANVEEHIDDAKIQQFVNSKTSSICIFNYRTITHNDCTIGIIEVPVQTRPVFVSRKYGKVLADTVYVRRGSCISIAKPDEIAEMRDLYTKEPEIDVHFWDEESGTSIGNIIEADTSYIHVNDTIPDYIRPLSMSPFFSSMQTNKNYYRQLIEYIIFNASFVPIHIAITNAGNIEALNIHIELRFNADIVSVRIDGEEPKAPSQYPESISDLLFNTCTSCFRKRKVGSSVILSCEVERLHAKRSVALEGTVFLKPNTSGTTDCVASISWDGAARPIEKVLQIAITETIEERNWNQVKHRLSEMEKN